MMIIYKNRKAHIYVPCSLEIDSLCNLWTGGFLLFTSWWKTIAIVLQWLSINILVYSIFLPPWNEGCHVKYVVVSYCTVLMSQKLLQKLLKLWCSNMYNPRISVSFVKVLISHSTLSVIMTSSSRFKFVCSYASLALVLHEF